MRKLSIWIVLLLGGVALEVACDDPLSDQEKEEQKILQDSLDQAEIDNALIDAYLSDSGLDELDVITTDEGIRYIITDLGDEETFPEYNDIVSMHYTSFLLNDSIFRTTDQALAMSYDSAGYVAKGVNVSSIMSALELDLEGALDEINSSNDVHRHLVYSSLLSYDPLYYNYISTGSGLSTSSFIEGFITSLDEVTPLLSLGGKARVFVPSAVGYPDNSLTANGRQLDDTVLMYEFALSELRP